MTYYKVHTYMNDDRTWRDKYIYWKPRFKEGKESHTVARSVVLYKEFLHRTLPCKWKWSNYSNYGEGRLTLRFEPKYKKDEVSAKLLLKDTAQTLIDEGWIERYELSSADVPDIVKAGHQLSTDLAVEICNSDLLSGELKEEKIRFMVYFTNHLFKYIGRKKDWFVWDELRYYTQREGIEYLDNKIKEVIESTFVGKYDKYLKDGGFIERTLHLMMNCLLLQNDIKTSQYGEMTEEGLYWLLFNRAGNIGKLINA